MTPAYFVYIQKDRRYKPEIWTLQDDIAVAREEARHCAAAFECRVWVECNFIELAKGKYFDE